MDSLRKFRDNSEGSTPLCWSEREKMFFAADSLGLYFTIDPSNPYPDGKEIGCEQVITQLSAQLTGRYVAFGTDSSVFLRPASAVNDKREEVLISRPTLPVTGLIWSKNGQHLLISSREPDISIYSMDEKTITSTISTASVGVRSICLSTNEEYLAVIDENGAVIVHSMTTGVIVRQHRIATQLFSIAPKAIVRDHVNTGLRVSWLEKYLLVPSSKGVIAMLAVPPDPANKAAWKEEMLMTDPTLSMSHQERDVNLVVVSPSQRYLASADVDGRILIWQIDTANPSQSKPIRCIDNYKGHKLIDLAWGPYVGDNYLMVLTGEALAKIETVIPHTHEDPALPATTGTTGDKVEAELTDEQLMAMDLDAIVETAPVAVAAAAVTTPARRRLNKAITSDDNDDDELDFGQPLPVKPTAVVSAMKQPAAAATESQEETVGNNKRKGVSFAADEAPLSAKRMFDEKAEVEPKKSKKDDKKKSNKKSSAAKDDDDDESDDDEEDSLVDKDDDDEDAADLATDHPRGKGRSHGGASTEEVLALLATHSATPKFQTPFMPSSTKLDEKGRRYLVWNCVGNITLSEGSFENRIEIRFTDASGGHNRNEAFPDRLGFIIGSLGYDGAAFATAPDEAPAAKARKLDEFGLEEETASNTLIKGSTLFYHAFGGNRHLDGVNDSFRVTLSDAEAIVSLAVGAGFIAVGTSKQFLRLYSSTGVEVCVMSLSGPVVSMVALGLSLAVVYHDSCSGSYYMDLWEVSWRAGCSLRSLTQHLPLPLTPQTTIEWLGYDTESNAVMVLDTKGILRVCLAGMGEGVGIAGGWKWVPVMNIPAVRKTVDHRYWPICVRQNKLIFVLLNGESRPEIYPQPIVSTKALRTLTASNKDGSEMNEAAKEKLHGAVYDRLRYEHVDNMLTTMPQTTQQMHEEDATKLQELRIAQQAAADKSTLKALQDACQLQQIPLAMSLALRLTTANGMEAGIRIANHFGRVTVATALDSLLQHRSAMDMILAGHQPQMMMPVNEAPASTAGYDSYQGGAGEYDCSGGGAGGYDHLEGDYQQPQQVSAAAGGILSRKASIKQQQQQAPGYNPKTVTPTAPGFENAVNGTGMSKNPFAVVKTGMTPQKRSASMLDGLQSSPSPKKPTLNRQSTFSQNARQQRLSDKRIL